MYNMHVYILMIALYLVLGPAVMATTMKNILGQIIAR